MNAQHDSYAAKLVGIFEHRQVGTTARLRQLSERDIEMVIAAPQRPDNRLVIAALLREPLHRANHLSAGQWDAISDAYARLAKAVTDDDRPLVVGASKELVECVARVTLTSYGHATSDNDEYTKVVGAAHKVVEHVAGAGLPRSDPLRAIPDNAKKIALQLAQLRNRYGTGHGRAVLHGITPEVVEVCVHGALIWVRWTLTRLDKVLLGAIPALVRDLEGHETFFGGDLATRLAAANVSALGGPDQRRLGLAIGRRAAKETFNVRIEGIDACAQNPTVWPDAYREGVVQGLFLNEDGQMDGHPRISAPCAVEILKHHSNPEQVLTELRASLRSASWSPAFVFFHDGVLAAMREAVPGLDSTAVSVWTNIIEDLEGRTATGAT